MGHAREQVAPRMQTHLSEKYAPRASYFHLSTRPLHVLVFLLPLIVLYELGSVLYLSGGVPGAFEPIRAYRLLSNFFVWFGVSGLYLPGILLLVMLFVWHLLTPDRWKIDLRVLGWMLIEAVAWTIPLLVFGQMIFRAAQSGGGGGGGAVATVLAGLAAGNPLAAFSAPARATISIGAGLYEELLFRLVAISLVHLVACDLLRVRDTPGRVIAVVLAAVAFALNHDVLTPQGTLDTGLLVTYLFAGLYFGAVYAVRGFGIVVATHVLYDLAVLVLLPG